MGFGIYNWHMPNAFQAYADEEVAGKVGRTRIRLFPCGSDQVTDSTLDVQRYVVGLLDLADVDAEGWELDVFQAFGIVDAGGFEQGFGLIA